MQPIPGNLCNNYQFRLSVELVCSGKKGVPASHRLKEEATAFARDRQQSHISFSIFTNNRAGLHAIITWAAERENVCVLYNCRVAVICLCAFFSLFERLGGGDLTFSI